MAHVIFPFYFTIRLAAWYTLCKPSQKLVIILLFTPEHALQTCASYLQFTKQTCSMVHAMQTSTEAWYPSPIHTKTCSANLRIPFAIHKTNVQHGACFANPHRSLASLSYSYQSMLCKPAHFHLQFTKQTCSMVHALQTLTEAWHPSSLYTRSCSANLDALHTHTHTHSYSHQNILCGYVQGLETLVRSIYGQGQDQRPTRCACKHPQSCAVVLQTRVCRHCQGQGCSKLCSSVVSLEYERPRFLYMMVLNNGCIMTYVK